MIKDSKFISIHFKHKYKWERYRYTNLQIINDLLIRCNRCNHDFIVDKDELEISTGYDDRPMGPEVYYNYFGERTCEKCGNNITYEVTGYEYPVGSYNYSDHKIKGGTFLVNPQIDVVFYDFEYNEEDSEYYRPIIDDVQTLKNRLDYMSPRDFEFFVERYFQDLGFETTVTNQTRDGGFDIICKLTHPFLFVMLVECKKWSEDNKVDVSVVRNIYGVHTSEKANKSVIVTTSRFTKDAIDFARKQKTLIELIDIDDLIKRLLS